VDAHGREAPLHRDWLLYTNSGSYIGTILSPSLLDVNGFTRRNETGRICPLRPEGGPASHAYNSAGSPLPQESAITAGGREASQVLATRGPRDAGDGPVIEGVVDNFRQGVVHHPDVPQPTRHPGIGVLQVRLDCTGRYGGLPRLWHDQTKVGNLDAAIRIPERIYQILGERQAKPRSPSCCREYSLSLPEVPFTVNQQVIEALAAAFPRTTPQKSRPT
jgi:hypothetical protein